MTFAGAATGTNVYTRTPGGVLEGKFVVASEPQAGFERMIPVTSVLDRLDSK